VTSARRMRLAMEGLFVSDLRKLLLALAVTVGAALATPASQALAVITGGCTASGSASRSGSVDLATEAEWRLRRDDVVNVSGRAPREQTAAQASAYAFFVPIALLVATGKGPEGSAGPYAVSDYAWIARVFVVAGSSDTCSGSIRIVIEDVNQFATLVGGGGLLLFLVGMLGVIASALGRGLGPRLLGGGLGGLLAGFGLALLLPQLGVIDPRDPIALVLLVVGLIIGTLAASIPGRRPPTRAASVP
jgi:hypothetical protein